MSKFKSYKSFLIDIGTTITQVKDEIKGHIVNAGWTLLDEASDRFSVVPGVGGVGNSLGSDALRFIFTNTEIQVFPAMRYTQDFPAQYEINIPSLLSSQSRKLIVSIGGVQEQVVDMTSQTSLSAWDFTNYIANVLNSSANANIRKFTWNKHPSKDDTLMATGLSNGIAALTTNTPVVKVHNDYVRGTVVNSSLNEAPGTATYYAVSVDYASGFIYFLSIHERTITIATKTTASYSTPVSATFIPNQISQVNCPEGCVPIELYLIPARSTSFFSSASSSYVQEATTTYLITHSYTYNNIIVVEANYIPKTPIVGRDVLTPGKFSDGVRPKSANNIILGNMHRFGVTGIAGNVTKSAYPFAVVSPFTRSTYVAAGASDRESTYYVPSAKFEDVFTFVKDATDESLHLIQNINITTKVTTQMSGSDLEVFVGNTDGFPTAGTITIDSEIIEYTGKTATSFTGLSRGKYGTTAASHIVNANIYNLTWYMKVKQGAMVAGYTRPQG